MSNKCINVKHGFLILVVIQLMIPSVCNTLTGQITANFKVKDNSSCGSYTEFENESSDSLTNYLWEIKREGFPTLITPTKHPIVSFDNINIPTELRVKLTAFNVNTGATHDTTKRITIYPAPSIQSVGEWQTMVCSNTGEITYCVEFDQGHEYSWSLTGEGDFFELKDDTSNCPTIVWKRNTGIMPSEVVLTCKVTSEYGCMTTLTKMFLLLPDAVPESASIIRKDDTNILLCVFDRPTVGNQQISGNYLYQWGFHPKTDHSNSTLFPLTENAYYQFQVINEDLNTYFVDVLNTDYSFCKTRIEGIAGQTSTMKSLDDTPDITLLKLYPNPVQSHGDLHIELIRNKPTINEVNFVITSFAGAIIKSIPFKLSNEINQLKIPIGDLNNGFYLLEAVIEGDQRVVKKFVVLN